ncbi:hypothetical protein ACFL59_14845, partial [Planctomycetota bacterium]
AGSRKPRPRSPPRRRPGSYSRSLDQLDVILKEHGKPAGLAGMFGASQLWVAKEVAWSRLSSDLKVGE